MRRTGSHRVINGLEWAVLSHIGPGFSPTRARGAKAQGLRYERALARALPWAKHGQWIEFQDRSGHGWAQPDLILSWRGTLVVLEAKYTWVAEGHSQLESLYLPLLRKALLRDDILGIVVCKNLTPSVPRVCASLEDAIDRAASGSRSVLHWLGSGPLMRDRVAPPIGAKGLLGLELANFQKEMLA